MNRRQKGARDEREFSALWREHGFSGARRSCRYAGRSPDSADGDRIPPIHVRVKRVERLSSGGHGPSCLETHQGTGCRSWHNKRRHCDWLVTVWAGGLVPTLLEMKNRGNLTKLNMQTIKNLRKLEVFTGCITRQNPTPVRTHIGPPKILGSRAGSTPPAPLCAKYGLRA